MSKADVTGIERMNVTFGLVGSYRVDLSTVVFA